MCWNLGRVRCVYRDLICKVWIWFGGRGRKDFGDCVVVYRGFIVVLMGGMVGALDVVERAGGV